MSDGSTRTVEGRLAALERALASAPRSVLARLDEAEAKIRALEAGPGAPTPSGGSLHDTDPLFRTTDEKLNTLWTWAVGRPGYDKKQWQALEEGILALARRATKDEG